MEVMGLPIYYQEDVADKLHRLQIIYENGRLGLRDTDNDHNQKNTQKMV
ncbi:hypothetical protein [Bacillus sp. PS06]|nr:hypothetical protein [Bacillus sp. PS06]MBD8069436.1 hypothetical protein [Bacillus sp. PS06]